MPQHFGEMNFANDLKHVAYLGFRIYSAVSRCNGERV